MHCAWCEGPVHVGIVTAGDVVYHLPCWRQRVAFIDRALAAWLPIGDGACDPPLHAAPSAPAARP